MDFERFKHIIEHSDNGSYLNIIRKNDDFDIVIADTVAVEDELVGVIPVISPRAYGNKDFQRTYGTEFSYYAGSMAHGISSEKMVIELGKSGFLGSFGTGGLSLNKVEKAIGTISAAIPDGSYLFNILARPGDPRYEYSIVELFLRKGVHAVEASAFVQISEALVYYRIKGLRHDFGSDSILCENHIIAKASREEVAECFMLPPPQKFVSKLLSEGRITAEQAEMAENIAMADDITVEGDSGGHTDNRPLVSLLPAMIAMRDSVQKDMHFKTRIGAAGGIGTPRSVLAAFKMGADYVVTGSVNQSCVEAGTSNHVKQLLTEVKMADVTMAPSADMFEHGGNVEVLKKRTLFPQNARTLYNTYCKYSSISEIEPSERKRIETRILRNNFDEVWNDTRKYFSIIDPSKTKRAERDEKYKMALIFRWYLGNSVKWAVNGDTDRKNDMQIWCGQSMGAFNNWVKYTRLEAFTERKAADIALMLMKEAALLDMYQMCKLFL